MQNMFLLYSHEHGECHFLGLLLNVLPALVVHHPLVPQTLMLSCGGQYTQ